MKHSRFLQLFAPLFILNSPLFAQTILTNEVGGAAGSQLMALDDAAITPDGKYIVVRENTQATSARVYDAKTGAGLAVYPGSSGTFSGAAQDAVAVTNTRAVVLGNPTQIIDLTNLGAPAMTVANLGVWPRDLEITPDGSMVAIRGGNGLSVYELNTGTQVALAAGLPRDLLSSAMYDVDGVAVTDQHAAFLSQVGPASTRLTIMDLHPAGGGNPVVVYETGTGSDLDLMGPPHDLAITPDGTHVAVRSELAVGLFRLTGAAPQRVWVKRLYGNPGPFGLSAMDSVEVTNNRIATISRWSNGGFGTQVDLFDLAGNQHYEIIGGDPHDLAITPNGARLLVRTNTFVYMYAIENLPGGPGMQYISKGLSLSTHTNFGAGMDSLDVTNEVAVSVARYDETGHIHMWDIVGQDMNLTAHHVMDSRPVDLAITPSEDKVVISGFSHTMIIDMVTGNILVNFESNTGGGYPWSDGVALDNSTAITFGSTGNGCAGCLVGYGWLTITDLFDQPSVFCASNANSSGATGKISATGGASIASNNLHLVAHDLPAGSFGVFAYGDAATSLPFGNGVLCVAGQSGYFPVQQANGTGVAELAIDSMNLPFGTPAFVVGSSRYFQFLFRDASAGQANTTEGLEVLFTL